MKGKFFLGSISIVLALKESSETTSKVFGPKLFGQKSLDAIDDVPFNDQIVWAKNRAAKALKPLFSQWDRLAKKKLPKPAVATEQVSASMISGLSFY